MAIPRAGHKHREVVSHEELEDFLLVETFVFDAVTLCIEHQHLACACGNVD